MSDPIVVALTGLAGVVVGVIGKIIVARIQSAPHPGEKTQVVHVLNESVDLGELRILRALFGEPGGRLLSHYSDDHYSQALAATIRKGWVKRIDNQYYMTPKGKTFSRAYFEELFSNWEPLSQVLN